MVVGASIDNDDKGLLPMSPYTNNRLVVSQYIESPINKIFGSCVRQVSGTSQIRIHPAYKKESLSGDIVESRATIMKRVVLIFKSYFF